MKNLSLWSLGIWLASFAYNGDHLEWHVHQKVAFMGGAACGIWDEVMKWL